MQVVIYGRQGCTYCDLAKDLLNARQLSYEYIDINEDFDAAMDFKKKFGVIKSVPQILVDNKLVGGYNSLLSFLDKETNDE